MSPNANGAASNGNGVHANGNGALYNGTGHPAVAPKSAHANRWEGVERPYSQVMALCLICSLVSKFLV